jgi:hypothetical protein
MNFGFNRTPFSRYWFFTNMALSKVVHHLKICHTTEFNGTKLTGGNFASLSEVRASAIFGMVEATVLKSMTSRFLSIA